MLETTMLCEGVAILTENVDGEIYLIQADFARDILDDWERDCEAVPANDAKVYFLSVGGEPVNPQEYTDFESVIRYLKEEDDGAPEE